MSLSTITDAEEPLNHIRCPLCQWVSWPFPPEPSDPRAIVARKLWRWHVRRFHRIEPIVELATDERGEGT